MRQFGFAVVSSCAVACLGACGPGLAGYVPPEFDVGAPIRGFSTSPPSTAAGSPCATQQWWTRGDSQSSAMHPGYDCTSCHRERHEGPVKDVMGTVFFRVDDEDDCRGIPGVRIEILDEFGVLAFASNTNDAGNFLQNGAVPNPYTARVVYEGRTREMLTPQTQGSCNSCHTAAGLEGAPGRIQLP